MRYDKWIPVVFLFSYTLRILILGATGIADAFVILSLSLLYGYRMYLDFIAKPDPNALLDKKIENINVEIQQIKNSVNVVKLTSGIKNDKPSFKF